MQPLSHHEQQLLSVEIDTFADRMVRCYHQLSPEAQAAALAMGQALAKIRARLLLPRNKVNTEKS